MIAKQYIILENISNCLRSISIVNYVIQVQTSNIFQIKNANFTKMIEVSVNDRLGKKIKVKCMPEDTIEDFKKILSLQIGTSYEKIALKKGNQIFKNHITLDDYEVHDGFNFELYYT